MDWRSEPNCDDTELADALVIEKELPVICIYAANETDFTGNGLGVLNPSTCIVTETLNGEWELSMTHPMDTADKWMRLQYGCIIKAPVPASVTPRIRLINQADGREIYRVIGGRLRLRTGPSTSHRILKLYPTDTEIIILHQTSVTWYEVLTPDGNRGYMHTDYLEYVRTETSAAVATGRVVEARQLREQPFRIYRVVPELNQISVFARHIFYDLMDNMIVSCKPGAVASATNVINSVFNQTRSPHDFCVYTDLTGTTDNVEFENINPVEALLGEGGLVEMFGGELARDWYDVFVVGRVGTDSDVQIRQGKNLLGITYDVDETDVITRILPTGETEDGELLYLNELYIDSPNIGSYPHPKWYHLQVSDAKVSDELSVSAVKNKLRAEAQKLLDSGCDLPTVTLDVDFINVKDTVEYAAYTPLMDIFIGDAVTVIVEKLGVAVALRMTQYTYDCLLKRYTSVTLGTVSTTMETSMISARQIAAGSISSMKLALNSIGSGQLQNASVGSLQVKTAAIGAAHIQLAAIGTAHIQDAAIQTAQISDAAITRAKIAEALVETLTVNALIAVTARIQELAAGNITADELYASIAAIAVAQMTTANIQQANIQWADIQGLAAQMTSIAQAQITTANINSANIEWAAITGLTATVANLLNAQIASVEIDWANITNLTAEIANIVNARIQSADIDWASITGLTTAVAAILSASIGSADIDWAHIKDLATDTAIITQGVGGELYIAKLAVTEANLVSLTVGELIVKGADGGFYAVSVDGDGNITTSQKQITNTDVADTSINAGEKLIEGSVTAATLNAQDIFADSAIVRSLIAANLDVDTLFARQATINILNTMDISGNEYLRLMVDSKADAADVDALTQRISNAELKITDDAIVSTVTSSQTYQQTQSQIYLDMDTLLGYRVEIHAETTFLTQRVRSTLLTAKVYHGVTDVTDDLPDARFQWKRESNDITADGVWNADHQGMKSVVISGADVFRQATFRCELLNA